MVFVVCLLLRNAMCAIRGLYFVFCILCVFFFFQAEDGIRDLVRSRGLGDVYKRQILGGAYCSLSKAFGNIDHVYEEVSKLEEAPRLLDFVVMGEALSRVWGENEGSFIEAYNDAQGKKSAENITANLVINALIGYIKDLEKGAKYDRVKKRFDEFEPYTYYGPVGKLAGCLREFYVKEYGSNPIEREWPQTEKAFAIKIKESMMGLKNSGIDVIVDEKQTGGSHYHTIKASEKIKETLAKAW